MVEKPTHFVKKPSSSIDLIFSANVRLTKTCKTAQSLYEKCHHNIICRTLNFNIPVSPTYYRDG